MVDETEELINGSSKVDSRVDGGNIENSKGDDPPMRDIHKEMHDKMLEEKAVELYLATGSPKRVEEELGIPKWKLYRILRKRGIGPLTSRRGRGPQPEEQRSQTDMVTQPQGISGTRDSEVTVDATGLHETSMQPRMVLARTGDDGSTQRVYSSIADRVVEREMTAVATPIIRKVMLNPKILLFYDYMKSKGYTGDLGDFIVECIELLFRKMGYQVVIERRQEVD